MDTMTETKTHADDIQYMQTVRDDAEEGSNRNANGSASFTSMIDPPRTTTTTMSRKFSFESDDDILITTDDDDDVDYELSSTSSSDEDSILKRTPMKLSPGQNITMTSQLNNNHTTMKSQTKDNRTPMTSQAKQSKPTGSMRNNRRSPGPPNSSFMDVLNEILEEKTNIPSQSKLGPKPWLMKQHLPKPVGKYEVSSQPFVFKSKPRNEKKEEMPKPVTTVSTSEAPKLPPEKPLTISSTFPPTSGQSIPRPQEGSLGTNSVRPKGQTLPLEDLYSRPHKNPVPAKEDLCPTPPSRGRASSASSGNAISDNEKSFKYPSEADTGFGSNTSSNASPSNSSNNGSRLPSREEVSTNNSDFYKIAFVNPSAQTSPSRSLKSGYSRSSSSDNKKSPAADVSNAHELARAAIQALSLSKNILQGKENARPPSRGPDSIYDEVPVSPSEQKSNVYDDVPPPGGDVTRNQGDGKRKVISVPVFKPPAPPTRNDRNHPMSSEPIYDVTRSNTQTPTNVSSGALDLMYQLFGKDLSGRNPPYQQYGRPPSAKSVTFEDEMKSQGDMYSSRPSSRAGSISDWSDCTINMSEYPESEASTIQRTTLDFPRFPQVGLPTQPMNPTNPPIFPTPQGTLPPINHPFQQQQQLQIPQQKPNYPPFNHPQPPFPHPQSLYQTPNNIYAPRAPMFPNPQAPFPPHNPNFPPQETPGIRSPIYGSQNPYQPYGLMERHYPRPPSHAFSPPKNHGGNWDHFHRQRHHHNYPHIHPRGRAQDRVGTHRRGHSHSRSRKRQPSYSDEEFYSRSPSPLRHHHHRDDVIAGKSYIDGYKAALKDAVITFAEKQTQKMITDKPKDDREDRMQRSLRRALSAGRIHELPDNVELGDIRKAIGNKSYSDDEYDDIINDVINDRNLLLPHSGRPLSLNGSSRSLPDDDSRRRRRHYPRYHRNDDVIDGYSSGSEHSESCDCSECEEEFEMRERFHGGELMTQQPKRNNDVINNNYKEQNERGSTASPRMKGLRQRFIESMEESSGIARAPVRANRPQDGGMEIDPRNRMHLRDAAAEFDPRNRRAVERRRQNFEDVRPIGVFNGPQNYPGPPGPMAPYHQQRAPPNDWGRPKRVQFGYQ